MPSLSICRSVPRASKLQAEICLKHGSARGPYNGGVSTGQIQVDREAIVRTLCEIALSLNVILDELMITLEDLYIENSEADFDAASCLAGREM